VNAIYDIKNKIYRSKADSLYYFFGKTSVGDGHFIRPGCDTIIVGVFQTFLL